MGVLTRLQRRAVWALVLPLLSCSACIAADTAASRPGAPGPYRGVVVDAQSRKPLAGVLVVVYWRRPGEPDLLTVKEALTDGGGGFRLETSDVEAGLLAQSLPPRLILYKPGYMPYPGPDEDPGPDQYAVRGAPAVQFAGQGRTMMLNPASDFETRSEALNRFLLIISREHLAGPSGAPLATEVLRQELMDLGAIPRTRPGQQR
jgi:hypothetical protein